MDTAVENAGEDAPAVPASRPWLQVLVDCGRPDVRGLVVVLDDVDRLRIGRGATDALQRDGRSAVLTLADSFLSSEHAEVARAGGRWAVADLGSRNGTRVASGEATALVDGDVIEVGRTLMLFHHAPVPERAAVGPLATYDPTFADALLRLERVTATRAPILIEGESGTGKELVARAVHAGSGRPGAFVAVNCAALPATLVESELFGYRRGAFSGAVEDRPGLIRASDGGTLFLDEVGDLAPAAQGALLRVLQEREVLALGATKPVAVDLRVVCATHHDLAARVAEGSFRRDLFARLEGFHLRVPPLRQRRADFGVVLAALLAVVAPGRRVAFRPDAVRALLAYDWPLNIRELEQVLTTAVALAGDRAVSLEDLPPRITGPRIATGEDRLRADLERHLRAHRGNVAAVARATGKGRTQIVRWLRRFAMDPARFR